MRFVGDLRATDRDWARHRWASTSAWEETGFLPYGEALAAQRAADALLLLIPHAGGRGDSVLSGKVYEYLAAGRPILAAVPPSGVAADLIRRTGAGEVVDRDDAGRSSQPRWRHWSIAGPAAACPTSCCPAEERERLCPAHPRQGAGGGAAQGGGMKPATLDLLLLARWACSRGRRSAGRRRPSR